MNLKTLLSIVTFCFTASLLTTSHVFAQAGTVSGELRKWHKVTVTVNGPNVSESDSSTFSDYRMDVTFTAPSGARYVVPGYYAGDGNAANTSATSGNAWRAHIAPSETGTWQYSVSLKQGGGIAYDASNSGGSGTTGDGTSGTFSISANNKSAPDYRSKGLLEYVGKHHFRFAETGEYYLKAGADSPENFLGYVDFDQTSDTSTRVGGGTFLHSFSPHEQDWNSGDPTWQGSKGKGIIGAINYLSSKGGNSIYFLTYNIDGGDGGDTWPWTSTGTKSTYDVSKLDQWGIVLDHMTNKGIQLHVVLQETENDGAMGGLSNERRLYFREMIARYGHNLAIQWNLGEENNNSGSDLRSFANFIREVDPYDHPITVHTYGGNPSAQYDDRGLLGAANFEASSIQANANQYNGFTKEYRDKTASAGRPWAIYGDEQGQGHGSSGWAVDPDGLNWDKLRDNALWGNYLGGGAGIEWYFGYDGLRYGDIGSEDWRVIEPLWEQTKYAYDFVTGLPFWDMTPTCSAGKYCMEKPGDAYAVYTTGGSTSISVSNATYRIRSLNPKSGAIQDEGTQSGTSISLPDRGEAAFSIIRDGFVQPTTGPTNPSGCGPRGDLDCSGEVNIFDLSRLLRNFGATGQNEADIDGSGEVNVFDLSALLTNFGARN